MIEGLPSISRSARVRRALVLPIMSTQIRWRFTRALTIRLPDCRIAEMRGFLKSGPVQTGGQALLELESQFQFSSTPKL